MKDKILGVLTIEDIKEFLLKNNPWKDEPIDNFGVLVTENSVGSEEKIVLELKDGMENTIARVRYTKESGENIEAYILGNVVSNNPVSLKKELFKMVIKKVGQTKADELISDYLKQYKIHLNNEILPDIVFMRGFGFEVQENPDLREEQKLAIEKIKSGRKEYINTFVQAEKEVYLQAVSELENENNVGA